MPLVAVLIASLAALASTAQAWVSWRNKDIPLKTIITSQIVERCASLLTDAQEASLNFSSVARDLEHYVDAKTDSERAFSTLRKVSATTAELELILSINKGTTYDLSGKLLELLTLAKGDILDAVRTKTLASAISDYRKEISDRCREKLTSEFTR